MREVIEWLSREEARQDVIIKAIKRGSIKAYSGCIIARFDPVPPALKEALGQLTRTDCIEK